MTCPTHASSPYASRYDLEVGAALGDDNDAFPSGPPAQEGLRGAPDQTTGQNYASCSKKLLKFCLRRLKTVKILPPAVKKSTKFYFWW
jgi:hypothetical protein